ncbi:MAG TPA: efflux RND transporter periplasmic adaptor subunit [Candidatus Saccharicenans sp.]|nr:efflux RND transporter periplasmic adaptor subunit [Candidatus Saccharicenans sp.]HRD02761.1 efflux RND transporter periplasmic adaptor subunit [Candidatus Saccharicenans sp.]
MLRKVKSIPAILVLGGLVLLTFSGCQRKTDDRNSLNTQTQAELKPALVKIYKVTGQKIAEKLIYTASLEAWKKQAITPDISGKIARIYVNEGDLVGPGQLLAELDTKAIRLQLEQAEASLSAAKANLEDARRNMERMERLFQEKAVSEQQYEKARLVMEAAQAQKDQAEAAVNLAKHNLDVSLMKAPFAGVIASKNAEEGDVINPMMGGMSATSGVLSLVNYSRIKVKFDVAPEDIKKISRGQRVYLEGYDLPGQRFDGEISVVNAAADAQTKKFRVEALINNHDLQLKPGTFGQVIIEVKSKENALTVPLKALLENSYVMVVEGGRAVKKTVTTGLKNKDLIEITSGLRENDLVIVEGNFGLPDGNPVEVQNEVEK